MTLKAFAATATLGLASLVLVPGATADQWNKKTIITVGEPIQVPGKVLQPGKYVMRLMDSPANRHIVQIFNESEDQLQTTVLAIPNYRLQPTGETEFGWWETPAGQPKAMRAWFYPGDNFGQEFAYPKAEAQAIAARTDENVPTTFAENEADLATARVGTVDRAGTEMELDRETYSRADGAQPAQPTAQPAEPAREEPAEIAQATPQPAPAQPTYPEQRMTPDEGTRARQLPETATVVPMAGLAGLLALGASLAIRAMNRS
jgi:hypothetical protein